MKHGNSNNRNIPLGWWCLKTPVLFKESCDADLNIYGSIELNLVTALIPLETPSLESSHKKSNNSLKFIYYVKHYYLFTLKLVFVIYIPFEVSLINNINRNMSLFDP